MDYDLSRLGELQFEHLAQALAVKNLSAELTVYGAGRDGGREATWNGRAGTHHLPAAWDGYGVMQAKFRNHSDDASVGSNAKWVIAQIKKELSAWTQAEDPRSPIPDCYLIVTNVRLSAVPGSGVDLVLSSLIDHAKSEGLATRKFAVWSYDKLRTLLDDAADIRSAYAAWTTPGDVLSRLASLQMEAVVDLQEALLGHAARNLTDALNLNMSQAGSVADSPTPLSSVFMDLPARRDEPGGPLARSGHHNRNIDSICAEIIGVSDQKLNLSSLGLSGASTFSGRTVLVGGPGQGKSTVGQYLCQLYRAAFLEGSSAAQVHEVSEAIRLIQAKNGELKIPQLAARRWPMHITLTVLADSLAGGQTRSLLEFIAAQVANRSGLDVTTSQMRRWLRQYPWFLVLDGLDEVPNTSNRRDVLAAVSDFFIDAGTLGADVMVVATTRPQGYSHDFNPDLYQHFTLVELPINKALEYAEGLIDLRVGRGERYDNIVRQLRRAAEQPATARLMTTPLQSTIISFLVERIGQAPEERWRLFSEYYRVIYQREQSKPGELAALLTDYKTDVDAVHYTAALALQRGGENSGETQSVLSHDQLRGIVHDRLLSQGHDAETALHLADTLLTAATDRLVFLAILQETTIGFEIRSLQEFMAAAALSNQSEHDFADDLRRIATSSYWQNVLLFALGAVFADRPVLCGEVTTLIVDLNLSDFEPTELLPGSRLALEVLLDGIGRRVPRYHRVLLEHVARLVDLPPNREIAARFAELDSLGYAVQLDAMLGARAITNDGAKVMQIMIAACRVANGHETARQTAEILVSSLSSEGVYYLLEAAISHDDDVLLGLLAPAVVTLGPSVFRAINLASDVTPRLSFHDHGDEVPAWLGALSALSWTTTHHGNSDQLSAELAEQKGAEIYVPALGAHTFDWQSMLLSDGPANSPGFSGLRELADFALRPSAECLALALDALADADPGVSLLAAKAGWPLAACVNDAAGGRLGTSPSPAFRANLLLLAQEARDGLLGDLATWQASETTWKTGVSCLQNMICDHPLERGAVLGLGAYASYFPVGAIVSWSRSSNSSDGPSWTPGAIRKLMTLAPTQSRRQVAGAIIFWSAKDTEGTEKRNETAAGPMLGSLSELDVSELAALRDWLGEDDRSIRGVLGSLNPSFFAGADRGRSDILRSVGSAPYPGFISGARTQEKWHKPLAQDHFDWPIARLRLLADLGLPDEWLGAEVIPSAPQAYESVRDNLLSARTVFVALALDYKSSLPDHWEALGIQLLAPGRDSQGSDQLNFKALLHGFPTSTNNAEALSRALYLIAFFREFDPLSVGPLTTLCWESYVSAPVDWSRSRGEC